MNPAAWDRAKSLLADAAALPAAERERFVMEHCPDPALRRELLELLASPAPLTGIVARRALEPGARLGPYIIDRLIGSGGMGEVYKARDSALNRSVAIKVLPEPFVDDPERQARLRREAQLLAALNHPNIAHIYGLDESTGAAALVMELVDGPTLADRLHRAMPLAEALSIAGQIADALATAHEQGIIHRDLKPANIKVRDDGTVKVLDFGLAKIAEPASASSPSVTSSPTQESPAMRTGVGTILGTAAYMAPEQALGKTVDKRADIWSFGCVLYEMLTARRAFAGAEISDTLARVVGSDPDWTALSASTPPSILRLLRRCLDKPLNRRLADIADARLDIEEALSPGASVAGRSSDPATFVRLRRALPWIMAAACATALAAVLVVGSPWRMTPSARPMRFSVALGVAGAVEPGSRATLAISRDGATVAFVAKGTSSDGVPRLYARSLDRLDATQLPETDGAEGQFFSPDGQWIAFFASKKLKKIAVTGGQPIEVCDAPNGRGGSWGDDGIIVFSAEQQTSLSRVSSNGGTPQPITTREAGEMTQRWPQVLPGGKAVLYTSLSWAGGDDFNKGELVVQTLPAGVRKVVRRGAYFGRYALSGHLLYVRNNVLYAAPFDRDRLEVTGPERPVVDGLLISNKVGGSAMFAISDSGALVSALHYAVVARPIEWLDRSGQRTTLRSTPSEWAEPSFSPDGQRLALTVSGPKHLDVWIDDWGSDRLQPLTHFDAGSSWPVWTPDGHWIVFSSQRDPRELVANLYSLPADGTGTVQRLTTSPNGQVPGSWHPSGKVLAFTEQGSHSTVMLLPMEGDEGSGWKPGTPTAFVDEPFDQRNPAFSRDGRWLAYESNQSGRYNVAVRPYPGPGPQTTISTSGGEAPIWSRARSELIYVTRDRGVMVVDYSVEGGVFHAGQPRPWPESLQRSGLTVRSFALHPDGNRLALPAVAETAASEGWERLDVALNFFDELRRLAPVQTR